MSEKRQHWRSMIDRNSKVFTHADLFEIGNGRDVTFRVEATSAGKLEDPQKGTSKRTVMVKLAGVEKPWGLNATNAKSIEMLMGSPYPSDWIGSALVLYITTTRLGGEVVDCIRVRPRKPADDAEVYGVAAFDLAKWTAAFEAAQSIDEIERLREELNKAKRPASARQALVAAVEAAQARIGAAK